MSTTATRKGLAIKLGNVETALGEARTRLATAKAADDDAQAAVEQATINVLETSQDAILGKFGNGPGRIAASALAGGPGGDGWAVAARELNLADGKLRVAVDGESLLRRPLAAGVDVSPDVDGIATRAVPPLTQAAVDRRYLFSELPRTVLDSGDLAISDFRMKIAKKSGTIAASTDNVTSTAHGFTEGDMVILVELEGGAPLELGATYWVRDATANTLKLAAVPGGAAIDVTVDATAVTLIAPARNVTGDVERDPMATSEKAKLALKVEHVQDSVRQFAALVEDVPVKLFDVLDNLTAFLRNELLYQLERGVDAHTISRILAADPLAGGAGRQLVAEVRYAIAILRDVGANPSVLALNPATAASLDLMTDGSGNYLFTTRLAGASSPLFALRVVEVPGLANPVVIDPAKSAMFYVATGQVIVDPYTGLDVNTVRVRTELEALTHVRDATGAYVVNDYVID
jgi:hypothetical protein